MNRLMRAWQVLTTEYEKPKRGEKPKRSQSNTAQRSGYNPAIWSGAGAQYGVGATRDLTYSTLGASLAYKFVPPVKACIDVIAENGDAVPLVITDGNGDTVARSDENPHASVMLTVLEDSWQFHKMSVIDLWIRSHLLWGMTFLEKAENRSGYVKALHWLNANSVTIDAPRGIIDNYRYYGQDRYVTYSKDEILYARTFNPTDDIYGFSKTLNVLGKVNAELNFEKFRGSYFVNGGQPGFAFFPDSDASEDQLRLLANHWKKELRGVENFFKTLISPLSGRLEQFDPVDLSKTQTVEDTLYDQIRQGFRVPAELIGDSKNNSYQFSDETKHTFMMQTVAPVMHAITEALNRDLYPVLAPERYEQGYRIEADFSAYSTVSEADLKAQQLSQSKFESGAISHHAYQKELGQEPEKGSRDFYVLKTGLQVIPVDAMGEPAAVVAPEPVLALPEPSPIAEPEPASDTMTLDDIRATARKFGIGMDQALRYFEEFERVH